MNIPGKELVTVDLGECTVTLQGIPQAIALTRCIKYALKNYI